MISERGIRSYIAHLTSRAIIGYLCTTPCVICAYGRTMREERACSSN